MNVQKAVVRIGRIVEHAPEFQIGHVLFNRGDVGFDRDQGGIVAFRAREREQVGGIAQPSVDAAYRCDGAFELFFFAPQFLGALRVLPDVGVFEFASDLR
ncbi:MAG: hypothetical protein A3H32_13665 [Betaproteobacteria bacterium RIFCSPLOWO2_02_FULL_63_19]|nr:MAG: hypothetical protein A3H32_13665 [Betaproteobacteria bacterium RIFCSPLOWO2_02_FULL_63_19]